ncbi:LysR family transcriptional regulator [Nioella nitratireducens]|uniref:LysR family transcriptional regulator n=1 Tax=Nioella nitratireducens TaxID=1287720 RepID=UPI0008FD622E|nr:LysR family transcriptional regulator [Nioella nitratireducens]
MTKTVFDWTLLRAFLAVCDTGSLSAAARDIGQSQPTLGRHIRALEEQAGGPLFERHARGLRPSALGQALLPGAEAMREGARQVAFAAVGRDQRAAGPVRVTASVAVSVYMLPPILAAIRAEHPEIQIDLVPSDRSENLLFHEADIALRMYRPEQLDMITRHLGDVTLGFYATPDYLARRGTPETFSDLMGHEMIGYDRDDRILRGFRAAGLNVSRDWFVVRTDDQIAYWELVCAGAGLGFGQVVVGGRDPRVRRIMPDAPLPTLPVWLTAHERTRHIPRVARVWEALAEGLRPFLS